MARYTPLLLRTLFLFILFAIVYFFGYLRPYSQYRNTRLSESQKLSALHALVLQNRVAFLALAQLEEGPNAQADATNHLGILRDNLKEGLASDNTEIRALYQRQEALLDELQAVPTFAEGKTLLHSSRSITLLTEETNFLNILNFKLQGLSRPPTAWDWLQSWLPK